jgi:hypothetical protein
MISDVLHDSIVEIKRYLAEFPQTYADDRQRIDRVLAEMIGLRKMLDSPIAGGDGAETRLVDPGDVVASDG